MGKFIDLTGKTFGRLTVVSRYDTKSHHIRWLCSCSCGNSTIVHGTALKNGTTISCGCYKKEHSQELYSTSRSKDHVLYNVWRSIKQRCSNSNTNSYKYYGGKGISVCEEWLNYDNFYQWAMSHGYRHGLEIDRIDHTKNYEPANCRWVDDYVQANNKGNIQLYEINGVSKSLPEWCREYNQDYFMVAQRVNKLGWDIKEALFVPKWQRKDYWLRTHKITI